ncbi:uncharacterized protein LOC130497684 [Raphanus sativus]|uniref:Uncharacterized protein LOC130497684 n=1 Tax=Raphanus sativus TaxID=3726 RepID=A0A9W3C562_RAPSA|nr:uncharacterized protein LOC130497684 [Raphanus sativus]
MFQNASQLQASGKALMDPSTSHPPTPASFTPHRLPDPPDPPAFADRSDTSHHNHHLTKNPLTSRLTKIGFPSFDGSQLREWLSKCDQFFDIDGTQPELKVRLAALHLTGKANQWHVNYMSTRFGMFPSWSEYMVSISSRFSELYDDPLAKLVALRQNANSVVDYLDKFETARMRITLPEPHTVSIFLANLNSHLSLHTRQFVFSTVDGAARIAMLHESSLSHTPPKPATKAPFNPTHKYNQPYYPKPSYTTPLLPSPTTIKPALKAPNPTDKQPRKFSYQEMQDRRAKGLCMFCDEVYTPGHSAKHKRAQIFVMECEEDE